MQARITLKIEKTRYFPIMTSVENIVVDLGEFENDPRMQKAAEAFVASLRGSADSSEGFGGRIALVVMEHREPFNTHESHDCSPSAAAEYHDQMSAAGNGKKQPHVWE